MLMETRVLQREKRYRQMNSGTGLVQGGAKNPLLAKPQPCRTRNMDLLFSRMGSVLIFSHHPCSARPSPQRLDPDTPARPASKKSPPNQRPSHLGLTREVTTRQPMSTRRAQWPAEGIHLTVTPRFAGPPIFFFLSRRSRVLEYWSKMASVGPCWLASAKVEGSRSPRTTV